MNINLNKARAARRGARGERPTVTLGSETFVLPIEPGAELLEAMATFFGRQKELDRRRATGQEIDEEEAAQNNIASLLEIARAVIGKEDWERFRTQSPSIGDLMALLAEFPAMYAFEDLGESQASGDSSSDTSSPSRPTSPTITEPTSPPRSGEETVTAR